MVSYSAQSLFMRCLIAVRQVRAAVVYLQDADKVNSFKHRMNTLAYGEAMMAAARDYGQVRLIVCLSME